MTCLACLTCLHFLACLRAHTSQNPISDVPKEDINDYYVISSGDIKVLKEIRLKYPKNIVIGSLNINSLPNKFDALKLIVQKTLDILVIVETKTDKSFPQKQFSIDGFSIPYRLDRNRHGGGVMIYVRDDIPSRKVDKHSFSKSIEAIFIEINFRKSKFLLV